ncbi:MoaD/ThiS family protein [Aestuariivivens sp. NBU2969]|uniref:MoaD/ThiS family protein n=1 Tax=Aestuariivivens sp. NBU2969 TaxID=2873267 RepID=UPI001CBACCEB|nr:MoaD/ThiS family protein [Aestuariivivens sp. NBU2969]
MISIKLKFTAQLKDRAGVDSDVILINEKDTLQDLIRELPKTYGSDFGAVLFEESGVYRHSNLIVVNQNQVRYEENIKMKDGMEIMLMSPISGG